MPTINVKFRYGDDVKCLGVPGKITAVFARGKGRSYEVSHLDNNGLPTSTIAEEIEIESNVSQRSLGFTRE